MQNQSCPYCHFTTSDGDDRLQSHIDLEHADRRTKSEPNREGGSGSEFGNRLQTSADFESNDREKLSGKDSKESEGLSCPLCEETCIDMSSLERHAIDTHSVNSDGLQRLLILVRLSNAAKEEAAANNNNNNINKNSANSEGDTESTNANNSSRGTISPSTLIGSPLLSHTRPIVSPNNDNIENDRTVKEENRQCQGKTLELNYLQGNCKEPGVVLPKVCSGCGTAFAQLDELHKHEVGCDASSNSSSHGSYMCWKKGCNKIFTSAPNLHSHFKESHGTSPTQPIAVSEKHVYKYRCQQCSLAFKTVEKLNLHSQYHAIRDATKCLLCHRNFRSLAALQKHVSSDHPELSPEEKEQFQSSIIGTQIGSGAGPVLDPSTTALLRKESFKDEYGDNSLLINSISSSSKVNEKYETGAISPPKSMEDFLNTEKVAMDNYNDPNRMYKCHRCRVAYTRSIYLSAHQKTLMHRKDEKLSFHMEKYLDPNRPHKCKICKESFTQKNILLVHYNSVSHLHKVKKLSKGKDGSPTILTTKHESLLNLKSENDVDLSKSIWESNENSSSTKSQVIDIKLHSSKMHSPVQSDFPRTPWLQSNSICKPDLQQAASHFQSIRSDSKAFETWSKAFLRTNLQHNNLASLVKNYGSQNETVKNIISNSLSGNLSKFTTTTMPTATDSALQCRALDRPSRFPIYTVNDSLPKIDDSSKFALPCRKPGRLHKYLLQSIGFDVVAQYVENELKTDAIDSDSVNNNESCEISSKDTFPELNKSQCSRCKKNFSSVWVLKAHLEEHHNISVSDETLNINTDQIRKTMHKKLNHSHSNISVPISNSKSDGSMNSEVRFQIMNTSTELMSMSTGCSKSLLREGLFGAVADGGVGGGDRDDSRERSVTPAVHQHGRGTPTPGRSTPGGLPTTPGGVTSPSSTGETTPTTSHSNGGNINPQMAEMAAAINALTAAQMQHQMPFNPMLMAGLGLAGLPLHLNPLAAMNLQPPLAPGLSHPMFDPVAIANMAAGQSSNTSSHQSEFFLKQQQQQQQQHQQQQQQLLQQQQQHQQQAAAAAAAAAAQQKRGRTRITDEQLKILRAHFDINNSPSEDQITDMAGQSGLPPKVIKHWFRNTLFKERQRCKDSPYNFSIPPSTTLNLEEYEKTGETKVSPLNAEDAREILEMNRSRDDERDRPSAVHIKDSSHDLTLDSNSQMSKVSNNHQDNRMHEKSDDVANVRGITAGSSNGSGASTQLSQQPTQHAHLPQSSPLPQSGVSAPHLVSSASCSPVGSVSSASYPSAFPPLSSPQTSLSLSSLISSQLENNSLLNSHKHPQTPPQVANSGLTHPSAGLSPTPSNLSYPTTPPGNSSSGKRANRTRFTDYQIKVLQEFFENNAYPKDDDLEYLSKLLNLSPRVIVVWFQNARQKARKVYENQPPIDPMEENAGRFTRTPGLNYQCKKCLLVFQRYYELIRHQKTHCFKEEDAKRSAQAQAAAAQAAALYHDDNSSHSSITENSSQSRELDNSKSLEDSFQCDKCSLVFNRFEQWREHQIVHLMNPALFMNKGSESPFPPLQSLPQHSPQSSTSLPQSTPPPPPPPQQTLTQFQQHQQQHQQQLPSPLLPPASPMKRKAEESEDEQSIGGEQQRDKRLRTTILPEQLDYLYQKYQMEANPSRKMLETIAHEVGLKKRVVQVWFQNTRARERKGQFRAHAQVINKKCPFCPAIFKVKSALESHLSTKHSDQFTSGEINIDALPDLDDHYGFGNFGGLSSSNHCSPPPPPHPPSMTQAPSLTMPSSLFSPSERPEDTLAKYHEEAIRRYLTDVSLANHNNSNQQPHQLTQHDQIANNTQNSQGNAAGLGGGGGGMRGHAGGAGSATAVGALGGFRREGEHPLDLSRPLELARSLGVNFAAAAAAVNSSATATGSYDNNFNSNEKSDSFSKNSENMNEKMYGMDTMLSDDEFYHMDVPETDENDPGNSYESNPTSPASSTPGSNKQMSGYGASAKRFRTQMTSTQVKLMKSVFVDYKTPTMAECEMFGREIQLPKRVIQVWFQNARAKEKKAKIALMKIIGQEPESMKTATECKVCNFEYSNKYSIQDHLFARSHIDNMRAFIEKQKEENDKINQGNNNSSHNSDIASSMAPFGSPPSDETANYQFGNQFHPNNLQLHMAQLMALNSQQNNQDPDCATNNSKQTPQQLLGNISMNTNVENISQSNSNNNKDKISGANLNSSGESLKDSDVSAQADFNSVNLPSSGACISGVSDGSKKVGSIVQGVVPIGGGVGVNVSAASSITNSNNNPNTDGDMNRLQLLHQVYQQMGINGNHLPAGTGGNSQHPLLQQPMIEG